MTTPLMQILDLVVRMNERDARKIRDIANGRLLELSEPTDTRLHPFSETRAMCFLYPGMNHPKAEGAELQRGLEEAVRRHTEAIDGPDEPQGHVGYTEDF